MPIEIDLLVIMYISFLNISILLGFYSYFYCEIYNLKMDIRYLEYKNKEFEKRFENIECEPTLMF